MATVYRTFAGFDSVFRPDEIVRARGTTLVIDGELFVKMEGDTLIQQFEGSSWRYSQREADELAALKCEVKRDTLNRVIEELRRPLPAAAQEAAAIIGGRESASGGRDVTPQPGDGGDLPTSEADLSRPGSR